MSYKKDTVEIHGNMLNHISSDYDKEVGSFIYDATKPPAMVLSEIYGQMDMVADKLSIVNLQGKELEQRVYEHTGLTRKEATKAKGYLQVQGNGQIEKGALFHSSQGIYFEAIETKVVIESAQVLIQAIPDGEQGNLPANTIKEMASTIEGITKVWNPKPISGGYEAEKDEDLLERYFEKKKSPATSGNISQYRIWAKEKQGVGDAKVQPLWNGPNTVKVVIVDAEMQPASSGLIKTVQDYIDPDKAGLGKGVAPIGARCTVESATSKSIDVVFQLDQNGGTESEVKALIEEAIANYFKTVAFSGRVVSYAKVLAAILKVEQVDDISHLKLNNGTENITLDEFQVPVVGGVEIEKP